MDLIDLDSLQREIQDRVLEYIQNILKGSEACQGHKDLMLQTLYSFKSVKKASDKNLARWIALPGLCCRAAGGDLDWADDIAASWFLFYLAAGLMDKIQDEDEPDSWWSDIPSSIVLNVASGLFFTASLALNQLNRNQITKAAAYEIINSFHAGFLVMTGGQHLDLLSSDPNLRKYWEIAAAKSGSFFSMACTSGARIVTDDPIRLKGFHDFGYQLGILIQVLDDLEDYLPTSKTLRLGKWSNIRWSLPIIYAMEVYPDSVGERLQQCLRVANSSRDDLDEAVDLINQSGAVLFIKTEIEHLLEKARIGLSRAAPLPPAGDFLDSLLISLRS